nr:fimbria/pilus periplasmic chaperone [Xanthomonas theicola]
MALLAALGGGQAAAASLQLAPTMLSLAPEQNADGLWLSNSGSAPVQVQVRAYRWTQHDGNEELQPTQELLISPPMRSLPAGERQLIRVIRADPAAPAEEVAYRVIVDELPRPQAERAGMQFVLRYSVPVFVLPRQPQPPQPDLRARLRRDADGTASLEVGNRGSAHAQIADLRHIADGSPRFALDGLVGYVLPGQTMRWSLGRPLSAFPLGVFTARINGEADERTLLTLSASP